MDASVLAAIAKWPNVPDVFGWLSLTARGQWRLRGEAIANPAIREFIGRNYAADARGRWYFQNGPQRVYVALERAPWVYRLQPDGGLRTFTGLVPQRLLAAALVDGASFVLLTDLGAGNVDDWDVERFLAALEDEQGGSVDEAMLDRVLDGEQPLYVAGERCRLGDGRVPLQRLAAGELERAYGFVAVPEMG